ncbi:MAG: hypothetical protein QXE79_07060 [Candidatus Bathyarchaeia archaeon]
MDKDRIHKLRDSDYELEAIIAGVEYGLWLLNSSNAPERWPATPSHGVRG